MRKCFINRSWQQLSMQLFLCAMCLLTCASTSYVLPAYGEEDGEGIEKRQLPPERDCSLCIATLDLESCTRCRNSKRHIIPYYTAKRSYYRTRSHYANNMCGCCAITRLTNNYCCDICNASKRGG